MIKSYGTETINKKSRRIVVKPQLAGIPDIDPAQLPEFPSATMIGLSVGDSSSLDLLTNLYELTFGIAPESNKP